MTSLLPRKSHSRAFTLIELLVVIGIIVLLATIALPMMSRAWAQAKRTQMAADLSVISHALEIYRSDFGDYPRIRYDNGQTQPTGASLLCWALMAPGPATGMPGADGADGPGFRLRGTTGTVKGPYLPADKFTVGAVGTTEPGNMASQAGTAVPAKNFDNVIDVLADRYYHPILYFPASKSGNATAQTAGAYIGDTSTGTSVFNYADTSSPRCPAGLAGLGIDSLPNRLTVKVMRFRMGDTNGDGILQPTETPVATGPFLLWSPGPDGIYGTEDDVVDNGGAVQLNTSALPSNIYP
jgi:prepilin-type N-terminal cleavage/methylation domain-containing protein